MTEYEGNPHEQSLTSAAGFVKYIIDAKKITVPEIPPICLITYSDPLLKRARESFDYRMIDIGSRKPTEIYFFKPTQGNAFAIVSPQYGAPMAACVLEELIALGFRNFVSLGTAGHPTDKITPELAVGDLVVIEDALRYESTSDHYLPKGEIPKSDKDLTEKLRGILAEKGHKFINGRVATIDAIYREPPSLLVHAMSNGAIALDMETSALFAVALHHGIPLATLLYISDILKLKKNIGDEWHLEFLGGSLEKAEDNAFAAAVELANRVK